MDRESGVQFRSSSVLHAGRQQIDAASNIRTLRPILRGETLLFLFLCIIIFVF